MFFASGSLYNNVAKPRRPLLNAFVSFQELVDAFMYVGFSSSTEKFSEVHEIRSWRFTSSGMPDEIAPVQPPSPLAKLTDFVGSASGRKVGVIAGVVARAVATLVALGFCVWSFRRRVLSKKEDRFDLVDQNLLPNTRASTEKRASKPKQRL